MNVLSQGESFTDLEDDFTRLQAAINAIKAGDAEYEAFYSVHMQPGSGKQKMEFVERVPFELYDWFGLLEYLSEEYGHGAYRIQLYSDGACKANTLVPIAKRKNAKKNNDLESGGIVEKVLLRMDENSKVMLSALEGLAKAIGGASVDRVKQLEELRIVKDLFAQSPAPVAVVSGVESELSGLQRTLELFKLLGIEVGGVREPEEKGFGDVLEKFVPLLMQGNQERRPEGPRVYRENPTAPTERRPMSATEIALRQGLKTLLTAASNGSDPGVYASIIFDQIPTETVKKFIASEGALQNLEKLDAAVALHKQWFEDLAEHCKAHLGMPSKFKELYEQDEVEEKEPVPGDGDSTTNAES